MAEFSNGKETNSTGSGVAMVVMMGGSSVVSVPGSLDAVPMAVVDIPVAAKMLMVGNPVDMKAMMVDNLVAAEVVTHGSQPAVAVEVVDTPDDVEVAAVDIRADVVVLVVVACILAEMVVALTYIEL